MLAPHSRASTQALLQMRVGLCTSHIGRVLRQSCSLMSCQDRQTPFWNLADFGYRESAHLKPDLHAA